MGEMGKGEMGTAHAGKPPSLPRELRTPLVTIVITLKSKVKHIDHQTSFLFIATTLASVGLYRYTCVYIY
jgi:hypothetical protein